MAGPIENNSSPNRVIVIGGSAGGVESLSELVQKIDRDLPAAMFVVLHLPSDAPSLLADILTRRSRFPVKDAVDGEPIQSGTMYIAPPGKHLLIEDTRIRLSGGPQVNGMRPAVDPLFQSAASVYGKATVGVILSGTLSDGTLGASAIKQHKGIVIAQDPREALFASMPASVIDSMPVDYVLPVREIATAINRLAREPIRIERTAQMPDAEQKIDEKIGKDLVAFEDGRMDDSRTVITCPACGGVLWELKDGRVIRYQCHVGHIYTPENLVEAQSESVETALWSAIRALVEKAALSKRLARRLHERNHPNREAFYLLRSRKATEDAEAIYRLLVNHINETSGEPNFDHIEQESLPGEENETE